MTLDKGTSPSPSHSFFAKSAPSANFTSTPRREAHSISWCQQGAKSSDIEDLAQALQRVLHENPAGGQEIAAMLRGLADEVGGKVEMPGSLFPTLSEATPPTPSPSWATHVHEVPSTQAASAPNPDSINTVNIHKTCNCYGLSSSQPSYGGLQSAAGPVLRTCFQLPNSNRKDIL